MVHHYAMCMNLTYAPTIDIPSFIIQHLQPATLLAKSILHVGTGSSKDILLSFLEKSDLECATNFDRIHFLLKRYGVEQVSCSCWYSKGYQRQHICSFTKFIKTQSMDRMRRRILHSFKSQCLFCEIESYASSRIVCGYNSSLSRNKRWR